VATSFKHLIIGAGPTGLGAAYRLRELGESSVLVLEGADHVGGLATSFRDDKGFTWDIGGHVQFSHYQYFDELMRKALGAEGWLHHQRESWAWMEERFVPYPVQNNIRYLSKPTMWKCLEGMVELYKNPGAKAPRDFHDWILATFGRGFADVFMLPYNFKVWAHPPAQMNYQWVGERVAVVDLQRVLGNVIHERDDLSWGPNNTFQFPKEGGTGAIWNSVAKLVGHEHIKLKTRVTRIDAKKKIAYTDKGEFQYEKLLNTMPLDRLVSIIDGADPALKTAASQLKRSTSHIVGIGMKGKPPEHLRTKCWMYFPEGNCPFYRTTVFSNYSPQNVPSGGYWSLMTETSESTEKAVSRATLVEDTVKGARATKLIPEGTEIVSTWMYSAEYGYPTPSLERDKALAAILPALDKLDVFSRGRFGAWKYEVSNQDHSCMQGVEWVNMVKLGIPELTLPFPNTANANWGKR
jgi:protoporphyrinogen oxidase